jgi:hypothetical protein
MRRLIHTSLLACMVAMLVAGVSLLPLPAISPTVMAQIFQPPNATPVSNFTTGLDVQPAVWVKYFGPGGAATTTVTTAGAAVTFIVNGAAYTGFECPVAGALGGIIDTSNAACNTLGEVVDSINSTPATFATGYFRAVIGAGLRTDSSNASFLAVAASNAVTGPIGIPLYWDDSVLDDNQIGLWDDTKGIKNWIPGTRLIPNPWADSDNVLLYGTSNIANAGALGSYTVYGVKENYVPGGVSSEVVRVMFQKASAATGVTTTFNEFLNNGGLRGRGEKVFVRVDGSGADDTAHTLLVTGYRVSSRQ